MMNTRPDLPNSDLELLSAYLDDALAPAERVVLETRLEREPALADALAALRETRALVRALPRLRPPRDLTLDPAVLRAVHRRRQQRAAGRVLSLGGMAAGFLLIAAGVFAPLASPPSQAGAVAVLATDPAVMRADGAVGALAQDEDAAEAEAAAAPPEGFPSPAAPQIFTLPAAPQSLPDASGASDALSAVQGAAAATPNESAAAGTLAEDPAAFEAAPLAAAPAASTTGSGTTGSGMAGADMTEAALPDAAADEAAAQAVAPRMASPTALPTPDVLATVAAGANMLAAETAHERAQADAVQPAPGSGLVVLGIFAVIASAGVYLLLRR